MDWFHLSFLITCWIFPWLAAGRGIQSKKAPDNRQLLSDFNDTQVHYVNPNIWCPPIQPTPNKERTLEQFRRKNYSAPLMFWHLQKRGGSSICVMMIRSYARTLQRKDIRENYHWSANCNDQDMSTNIVMNPHTYLTHYRPYGKYFVAIEPSYSVHNTWTWADPNDFPFKYHDQPSTKLLLDTKHPSTDSAWNAAVHFIAVRHPLESAISAFHYVFQPDRDTIFDRCDAFNMTLNACMLAVIQVAEHKLPSPALSSTYQRYQVEKNKDPRDKNKSKYDEEQLYLATASSLSKDHLQYYHKFSTETIRPPLDYVAAIAAADSALTDITNHRSTFEKLAKLRNQQMADPFFHPGNPVASPPPNNNDNNKGVNKARDDHSQYHTMLNRLSRTSSTRQPQDHGDGSSPQHVTAATSASTSSAVNDHPQDKDKDKDVSLSQGPRSWKPPIQPNPPEPLFSVWQEHRIRHQILGNYSINHLSLNNDIDTAKTIMRKFTLIVDLSLGEGSEVAANAISCTLGW